MQLGAMYPQYELGSDPQVLARFARAVEALGLDYLSYPDHVVAASPVRDPPMPDLFDENDRWQDPLAAFAFLAGVTERIVLQTGILISPQRQTALLARQAADVDLLCGERLRLAVGLGWNYAEYEAMGVAYKTRAGRMEEQIPILRALWGEPMVSFEGKFHHLDRATLLPRPRRQIPIWMGGESEPAFNRAARLADGFTLAINCDIAIPRGERVLHHLQAEGRDRAGFSLQLVYANLDRTSHQGTPPIVENLLRWRDWGGTHGSIPTTEQGLKTVDQHIDFLAEVVERLRS